ncbi:MAG: VWA domain-containing protein [Cytophagaceae bacterium]|nr:VWA domain-containing protein [Cytophagaceae bacterium]
MFLLDQSGSIVSTDPFDSRITAANTFLDNLGKNDKVGLSAFSDYGPTIYHNTGADPEKIRQTLEFLGDDEGGGTPLYLSTYNLTTELYKMSNSTNKALISFTDGADTNGGITPDQIIALAKEKTFKFIPLD